MKSIKIKGRKMLNFVSKASIKILIQQESNQAPIKRPLSRKNTSPWQKIIFFLQGHRPGRA